MKSEKRWNIKKETKSQISKKKEKKKKKKKNSFQNSINISARQCQCQKISASS